MSTLALGQAFGRVPQRWTAEGVSLSPVIHDHSRVNVEHAHEAAFVTIMLDGEYSEKAGLRSLRFERFSALFHPPGIEHQDSIGTPGVRLLMFEFASGLAAGAAQGSLRDLSGSREAWDLLALYRNAPGSDPLEFEERALELVRRIAAPARKVPRDLPSLDRAREYVRAHFARRFTMAELSRAAGVHPVYLGQMFRRELGESVADCVKRLRVRAAAEKLSATDMPIADIAFEYGFCDQSHFHRVFTRLCGMTPAAFRRAFE